MALAGMLELADREFQSIQDDDVTHDRVAKELVEKNKLTDVEITPSALKVYLDRRLGSDGRMSDFSYDWTVRALKRLGFRTLAQVDDCIAGYDDDLISRVLTNIRQGQLTRFEYLLLASMGEKFIERHAFSDADWWTSKQREYLNLLSKAKIEGRNFDPTLGLTHSRP